MKQVWTVIWVILAATFLVNAVNIIQSYQIGQLKARIAVLERAK